ncbi:galactose mutarotase-like protein [Daedalea quercina L-15889]|uniref:Galactose mutarotase-like protein n=1 Tax=Daedalea quercina L-15889 TaxID=1314783 RepID=A0A165KPZ9_9APHY|nr:galactose mutarotase-like protein [Daedalea quercina L-15889]
MRLVSICAGLVGLLTHSTVSGAWYTVVQPLDTIWISAPDKSINASYLPFGATQTSVWVNDKYGYDNTTTYLDPPSRQVHFTMPSLRVTYTLLNDAVLKIEINATTDDETPILLSSHDWWNLDGYHSYDGQNSSILNHTFYTPDVTSYVATDGILIPTGELPSVDGTPLDFRTTRTIGSELDDTVDLCGTGCIGYDTCFVRGYNATESTVALELYSPASGIKLSVSSEQHAIQLYSCDGLDGSKPAKASQGGIDGVVYSQYSCAVLEMEGVIDAINNPEWGIDQVYGPDRPYTWSATYNFTIA